MLRIFRRAIRAKPFQYIIDTVRRKSIGRFHYRSRDILEAKSLVTPFSMEVGVQVTTSIETPYLKEPRPRHRRDERLRTSSVRRWPSRQDTHHTSIILKFFLIAGIESPLIVASRFEFLRFSLLFL